MSALMLQKAAIGNVKNVQQDAQTAVKNLLITGVDAVIVAGTANFLNLLDLAPGRALKVSLAGSVPAFISENDVAKSLSCGLITTSMLGLAKDLSGEKMLGDLGANALGSVLGVQFADFTKTQLLPKLGIAGVIIGLNFASEKFSFSKVIQENTVLNWIDQLGR
ncbi:hypothetical protein [Arcanobacterium hippocoleae]|uniref:hypothetical protein n=1 Tax=Arcanobacterium hippocoleae TaxID=149017 RepID=UPI00333FBB1B